MDSKNYFNLQLSVEEGGNERGPKPLISSIPTNNIYRETPRLDLTAAECANNTVDIRHQWRREEKPVVVREHPCNRDWLSYLLTSWCGAVRFYSIDSTCTSPADSVSRPPPFPDPIYYWTLQRAVYYSDSESPPQPSLLYQTIPPVFTHSTLAAN